MSYEKSGCSRARKAMAAIIPFSREESVLGKLGGDHVLR